MVSLFEYVGVYVNVPVAVAVAGVVIVVVLLGPSVSVEKVISTFFLKNAIARDFFSIYFWR